MANTSWQRGPDPTSLDARLSSTTGTTASCYRRWSARRTWCSGQRYRLATASLPEGLQKAQHEYLAVYEIETDNLQQTVQQQLLREPGEHGQ